MRNAILGPFTRRRQQGEAGFTLLAVLVDERDTPRRAREVEREISPDCSAVARVCAVSCKAVASASSTPYGMAKTYLRHIIPDSIVGYDVFAIAAPWSRSSCHPAMPRHHRATPRNTMANVSGEPRMTFPWSDHLRPRR